jgi:hypothetical protein
MANDLSLTATNYVAPNIANWLLRMGFNSTMVIGGGLRVYVDSTPSPVPVPLNVTFLTTLKQVGLLEVSECKDCLANPTIAAPSPVLVGLPGLTSLYQIYNISNPASSTLTVQNTNCASLPFLKGLTCPPASISLLNNKNLRSLDGLDLLSTPTGFQAFNGVPLSALGSGPFTTVASLAAIQVFAGCMKGTSMANGTVNIPVGCSRTLKTYAEVCAFNGTAASCPPR